VRDILRIGLAVTRQNRGGSVNGARSVLHTGYLINGGFMKDRRDSIFSAIAEGNCEGELIVTRYLMAGPVYHTYGFDGRPSFALS
jgi:hypothetical protein